MFMGYYATTNFIYKLMAQSLEFSFEGAQWRSEVLHKLNILWARKATCISFSIKLGSDFDYAISLE